MSTNKNKAAYNAELLRNYQQILGDDVVKRRMNKGISQKNLAYISGIPQSTLSAIELGNSNATLDSLKGLAIGFKTSVARILREKIFH